MRKLRLVGGFFLLACVLGCKSSSFQTIRHTDSNGYEYEIVKNDPLGVRKYTLSNGLTVYMAKMTDVPRVQTYIVVRAGSMYDPPETTGLAHYLEHMMFKGNSKIGSLDWEKERKLLEQISALFEQHRKTADPVLKKDIYRRIDSLSVIASRYCVAGEYDKMVSFIGATGTNAWTSHECTVYVNDIPSNELDKWIQLESVRFGEIALRLFHTELEAVYEEFNMSQDRDSRKQMYALFNGLFPHHPYGTQTTLGKAEHLKNPSMVNIMNYFHTYYVPNNMAICLSGDIDYEKNIRSIDSCFGKLKPNPSLPVFTSPQEPPLDSVVEKNVYGPEPENLMLAFRLGGMKTTDRLYAIVLDRILNNGTAGLLDIDVNQQQKALDAYSWTDFMQYYGYFVMGARPRESQTLEEVKQILLEEIKKIREGNFPDWLVTASVNDILLDKLKQQDNYHSLGEDLVDAFTYDVSWKEYLEFFSHLEKVTKKDLVDFARRAFPENQYVVVYKRNGIDTGVVKIPKPAITKIELNRDEHSEFYRRFLSKPSQRLVPVFVDYQKSIAREPVAEGINYYAVQNPNRNQLFELHLIVNMGKSMNRLIPVAVGFLPYVGTQRYSPRELQEEFFRLGLRFNQQVSDFRTTLSVSGLNKSLEQAIDLLEDIVQHARGDSMAYQRYVDDIIKRRNDAKKSKEVIFNQAMVHYAMHGPVNGFNDFIPEDSLRKIKPAELMALLKELFSTYQHDYFYYGISTPADVSRLIRKYHKPAPSLKVPLQPKIYKEADFDRNRVYFTDYNMVQNQFLMLSKDSSFNPEMMPYAQMFSEYFGSGLSSVVFQEIRESRALAYAAYAAYVVPVRPWDSYRIQAFVATQPDKLVVAAKAMQEVLNRMPRSEVQFASAKESVLKRIESERITKTAVFWTHLRYKDLGIESDYRQMIYEKVKNMTLDDMEEFFNHHVAGKKYAFLVIGKKENTDINLLKRLGEYHELSVEELFRY